MFTHEQSNQTIYANLDETVIRATLRSQDLIPAFLEVIRDTPEYVQLTFGLHGDLSVISDAGADDDDERWYSQDVSYFLNEELWDVLNSYAPDGYYFGSIEGDASDYGYWKIEEEY